MRDRFQNRKCQEAARSLDGVNGAKNAPQQIRIVRVFLQFDQILIQAREVFVTLDQKFTNRFLIFRARVIHNSFRLRGAASLSATWAEVMAT